MSGTRFIPHIFVEVFELVPSFAYRYAFTAIVRVADVFAPLNHGVPCAVKFGLSHSVSCFNRFKLIFSIAPARFNDSALDLGKCFLAYISAIAQAFPFNTFYFFDKSEPVEFNAGIISHKESLSRGVYSIS